MTGAPIPASECPPPTVILDGGDIEIGAVEIKSGDSDNRAQVGVASAAAVGDMALTTSDPVAKAALDAIDSHIDGVETLLTAIDGHVDGLEAVEGTTGDAAVITNTTGTLSGKLRGLVAIFADVWDSTRQVIRVGGRVADNAPDSGGFPLKVGGVYNAANQTYGDGDVANLQMSVNGFARADLGTLIAGEDQTYNRLSTMPNYSYSSKTADGQVKASSGVLHSISVACTTATATAGLLTVYDNTAESGTAVWSEWVFATDVGHTIILDVACATGIYLGFDATLASVRVTAAYL